MITAVTLYLLLINTYGLSPAQADTLTCIAYEESKLKLNATHINDNETIDYGLFQINEVWLDRCNETEKSLLKQHNNIKCALTVLEEQGFKAWSTYRKCS
jgi:hypothetical protein